MCRSRDGQSRRDGTLLTVGFNLRKMGNTCALQSPAGTTYCACKCRPYGTWDAFVVLLVRRLKSTVNKISSLRDFVLSHAGHLSPKLLNPINH
jgi:hypothetical protein